jgi:hypothetical protein
MFLLMTLAAFQGEIHLPIQIQKERPTPEPLFLNLKFKL